jgi:hypothetical protein
MNLIPLFAKNFLIALSFVAIAWLYFQSPATVALGGFVAFLQEPTTAIIVLSVTLALVVVEWLS